MSGNETPIDTHARDYLKDRLDDQLGYYASAANKAKRRHYWIQSTMIVLAASVPVVVNLPEDEVRAILRFSGTELATVASLLVAILGGLANFRKDGDLWLNFRRTEELLKQEKFFFLTRSGPYRDMTDPQKRLEILAPRVEGLISAEHNKFRVIVEDAGQASKPHGDGADVP